MHNTDVIGIGSDIGGLTLSNPHSLNPLRQVLELVGESLLRVSYDPLARYHFL